MYYSQLLLGILDLSENSKASEFLFLDHILSTEIQTVTYASTARFRLYRR